MHLVEPSLTGAAYSAPNYSWINRQDMEKAEKMRRNKVESKWEERRRWKFRALH